MPISRNLIVAALCVVVLAGCNRQFYRAQADRDVASVVAEKSDDGRWALPGYSVEIDPRSRYFEPYNQDCPPMPEDDPAAHRLMHCVAGMKGWKKWHQNGNRPELENPAWQDHLAGYAPFNEKGEVILSLDSALRIAYVHSPEHQEELETIYLSALDVTTERFRLDTQFFGGNDTTFAHVGRLRPGGETNTLTTDTDLQMRRRFATAGELIVGFANSFVWQFAGPNTSSTLSLLNFSLVQPLLRGAGRDIALEQLTIVERGMLSNLRAYQRYRQGFFTDVAIGEGVQGTSRRGGFFGGTGLTGFTGQGAGGLGGVGGATGFGRGGFGAAGGATGAGAGFAGGGAGTVGGFIGLLQTLQEIRNSETSLNLQLRTLALLESSLDAGVIDLTQVDQFRQSIETQRATLLQSQIGLENGLETFKTGTLGLPPDLPITLDDSLIKPFQLIDISTNELEDVIANLQFELGGLGAAPDAGKVRTSLQAAAEMDNSFREILGQVEQDIALANDRAGKRREDMSAEERTLFDEDVEALTTSIESIGGRYANLFPRLEQFEQRLTIGNDRAVADELVIWLRDLLGVVQELSLVQARSRLESVVVDPIDLDSDQALQIALTNRLDIMNNRAALVDTWRLIQFNADALQSNLDVFFEGDLSTVGGDNPVKFRGPAGTMRAGVRFDAPFTRLLERNNYRQQLIEYQRARRQLIQFYDGINLSMRAQLRNLDQLRVNLEIQRRAVVIAIRRVDLTREELNAPQAPPQPGQPASQLGPTAATNLLAALSDLRSTQNNFMSVYLNYYASRMRLARDLGIMALDEEGRWIDTPLPTSMPLGEETLEEIPLIPPPIPTDIIETYMNGPSTDDTLPPVPSPTGPIVREASTSSTIRR